ncbi:uncharacterized protein [Watersipora subatra]|uniref:uncharacterized protein n=1 Tax=Watersipora subatra TaxID=2589382 RepID=UPI00355C0026
MNWPLNRRRLQYEPENSSLTICKKDNLAEFTFVVLEDNYDEKPTSELNTSSHSHLKNHYESLLVKVVLLLFAEQGEFTCSELAHIKPPYVYMSTRPGCYEFSLAHPHYPDQVVLIRISIMTFGVAFHCHAPKYIYFCFRNVPTLKQITDDSSEIRLMAMLLEKQFIERFIDPIKQAMDKEKTNPSASKDFESLTKGWSYNRRRLWTGNKSDLMNNSADGQNCDDD